MCSWTALPEIRRSASSAAARLARLTRASCLLVFCARPWRCSARDTLALSIFSNSKAWQAAPSGTRIILNRSP
eukprot:8720985-Pyramimonas_sp.AAC.1